MAKKRMPLYGIHGIFKDFLTHNLAKYQYFSMRPSLFVYSWILWPKNPKKCTKSAIYQFETFTRMQSPKNLHTLHFSIFWLAILDKAF